MIQDTLLVHIQRNVSWDTIETLVYYCTVHNSQLWKQPDALQLMNASRNVMCVCVCVCGVNIMEFYSGRMAPRGSKVDAIVGYHIK
jgi:hypothetical protein